MGRDGVLVLDKPGGLVSMRAVERVRRLTKIKKIGHAGTLDPAATGVLPLCLGQATKIVSLILGEDKEYVATVRLGIETDSYDLDGQVQVVSEVPTGLSGEDIDEHLSKLKGEITQRPPAFSAIRVGGQRLYDKARRGEHVEVPERKVMIFEIERLDWSPPDVKIRVRCGKGTYIRSIAADFGKMIGCGGVLADLRRTRVGSLSVEGALTLEEIEEQTKDGKLELISMADALSHLPCVELNEEGEKRIKDGRAVTVEHISDDQIPEQISEEPSIRILDRQGELRALAEVRKGALQPRRVFV